MTAPHRSDADSGSDGQQTLPFDGAGTSRPPPGEAAEPPIKYALTARARRVVAPATLPDLEVVPGEEAADPDMGAGVFDPFDTRPARARALRRSGRSTTDIASVLGVGPELVEKWCRDVGEARRRRHGRRAPSPRAVPEVHVPDEVEPAVEATARRQFREHRDDVDFLTGLAVVLTRARLSRHAVELPVDELEQGEAILAWLRRHADPDPTRIRLVLEVPSGQARDLVASRWAERLAIPRAHITASPRPEGEDGVAAVVRIAAVDVATTLLVWRAELPSRLLGADSPGQSPAGS